VSPCLRPGVGGGSGGGCPGVPFTTSCFVMWLATIYPGPFPAYSFSKWLASSSAHAAQQGSVRERLVRNVREGPGCLPGPCAWQGAYDSAPCVSIEVRCLQTMFTLADAQVTHWLKHEV
jgi:hypothetical protein